MILNMARIATKRNFSQETRRQVIAVLREILSDPDAGLALRTDFVQGLKRSIQAKKQGHFKALSTVLEQL